ncbi:ABC transporter permease [Flavivirga aquimarina]|uniref:ABC transporter permease n=1 Tax=Flavivirga aquimarina TaxID=2027862 RepID=A0ABT8WB35_9FLAO|nr:ABC transporter permease [Flavivirga aquimarina]MDO5970268.1 ABC transporter permease [Flavivirga aquimarina]
MKKIINLAITDFKIVFRDPSLKSFFFLPIVLFVLIIWGVPFLVEKYDFLQPYIPLFLIIAVIENTQLYCFVSSMVLIDEKETDVAKVYGVIPFSKTEYLISRFLIPFFFTVLLNVILLFVQPFYEIGILVNILVSLLAAAVVPLYAMAINSIVQNRMQGMVYIKAFNMLVLIPVAAFFVPESIKHVFGILPTHWIFQSIDNLANGCETGFMLGIGFLLYAILIWMVSKVFVRRHFI